MAKKVDDRVRVRAKQHGGEKPTYGDHIPVKLVEAAVHDGELSVMLYVGRERRAVVWVDIPIEVVLDSLPELWATHPNNQDDV